MCRSCYLDVAIRVALVAARYASIGAHPCPYQYRGLILVVALLYDLLRF